MHKDINTFYIGYVPANENGKLMVCSSDLHCAMEWLWDSRTVNLLKLFYDID